MDASFSQTQTDVALAQTQARYAQDPVRSELIACTRRFKSSWIDLAQALAHCRDKKQYLSWGFVSFEEYYRKELHLRQGTVDKLVGSYAFLHKTAPDVLHRDSVHQRIPSYQSVDFLRKAEQALEDGQTDEETVTKVRQAILEETQPLPKVSRIFRRALFPEEAEQETHKQLADAQQWAKKLILLLESLSLPAGLASKTSLALTAFLEQTAAMHPEQQSN